MFKLFCSQKLLLLSLALSGFLSSSLLLLETLNQSLSNLSFLGSLDFSLLSLESLNSSVELSHNFLGNSLFALSGSGSNGSLANFLSDLSLDSSYNSS